MFNAPQFELFNWAIILLERAVFGSRTAPEFAHPWSTFRPPSYLAGAAPEGIVVATRAGLLVGDLSSIRTKVTIHLPTLDSKEAPIAPLDDVDSTRQPVKLRLAKNDPMTPVPAFSVESAQEYRLAARLRSVSVLNRPCRHSTRPLQNALVFKRRHTDEPLTVLRRRNREAAEVVNLTILRAENQEAEVQLAA